MNQYKTADKSSFQEMNQSTSNYKTVPGIQKGNKPTPHAGILNAKTLAEENLKGFRLRNL